MAAGDIRVMTNHIISSYIGRKVVLNIETEDATKPILITISYWDERGPDMLIEPVAEQLDDLLIIHKTLEPYLPLLKTPGKLMPDMMLPATENADVISSILENFHG